MLVVRNWVGAISVFHFDVGNPIEFSRGVRTNFPAAFMPHLQ